MSELTPSDPERFAEPLTEHCTFPECGFDLDLLRQNLAIGAFDGPTPADKAFVHVSAHLLATIDALLSQLREQREQIGHLQAWGSDDGRTDWAQPLIGMLGDYHDEEACDCAADLAAEVIAHVTDLRHTVMEQREVIEAAVDAVLERSDDPGALRKAVLRYLRDRAAALAPDTEEGSDG